MSNVGEKIQLSRDEYRNITRCLENQEFRKLFAEYCEELNDPENKKQYEEELKILEAERGYDVKFIKPLPGYVIKTVIDGKTKAFVNVCHCDLIGKPASQGSTNENGQKGLKWSIPYAQCQPRKDYDNKKIECIVYDVVFHYDTLHLAKSNAGFRKLVTDTAIDAVESAFNVSLDRVNLKFPKLQYKGVPKMTVIRQKLNNFNSQQNDNIIDKVCPVREPSKIVDNKSANKENLGQKVVKPKANSDYATPLYKLIHRKDVEYHELTEELDAKMNAATPKELVLVIELPLLKSANDCTLNVTSKEVHLISEKPAKYKLEVKLPYDVMEKDGSAKFNIDEKTLTIVLPVLKARRIALNGIAGTNNVESNERKNTETPIKPEEMKPKSVEPTKCPKGPHVVSSNATRKIIFPKFSTNKMDNMFAFTINVRNVDPNSIELQKGTDTVSCRFTNIGNGFFPCYYVFFARFPNTSIADVQHEEWDNNFILQVVLEDSQISCFYAGADENDLVEYSIMDDISDKINNLGKEIEDDSLCIAVSKNAAKRERKSQLSIEIKTKSDTEDESEELLQPETKTDHPAERQDISMVQGGNDENGSPGTEVEMKTFEDVEETEKRDSVHESKKSKRHARRKNKKRSLSESCCDQLQVLVENERPLAEQNSNIAPTAESAESEPNTSVSVPNQRKARSVSESFTSTSADNAGSDSASMDNLTALIQFNRKYKGILKRSSFERSISECSSVDDHYYLGTSVDASSVAGSVDHANGELSESCRKHVRFNDLIKTKLFRSNTSILGQKKKNAKKNESKRRALTRRLSEGESTDNDDKDHVNGNEAPIPVAQAVDHEHDSGVSLDSDVGLSAEKDIESDAADQYQCDSKPIDINHNVGAKKFASSKKEDDSKKAKSSKRKNAKSVDSNNIEFKSDMIFDIEM